MSATDVRDELFSELHQQFLAPIGYRRRGRRSTALFEEGVQLLVELESSSWNSSERHEFGINLKASHASFGNELLMNVGLRRFADPPMQRWALDGTVPARDVCEDVTLVFSSSAVPLLHRMSSLQSLAGLCADFGPIRFFEARSWCLRRLGKSEEAVQVINDAIAHAPHEGFKAHAVRLLQRHVA
jgi:hypothetical protein